MFLEYVYNATIKYLKTKPKSERKKIGQFFTPVKVAEFMAGLMNCSNDDIYILDPGAGSGILTAALCDSIINQNIKIVNVHLYENNEDVLPLLKENMEYIKKQISYYGIVFNFQILEENFIINNSNIWQGSIEKEYEYDVIISNPPYKKIGKMDAESIVMKDIVYGQPNIYFLFMAMAAKLLKKNGQMIFINPRSFSSGAYFKKFRKWFFSNVRITNLHLFVSRDDIFNTDNVLQETIIIKAVNEINSNKNIVISESDNMIDFEKKKVFIAPCDIVIRNDDNRFMLIPTTSEEMELISFINSWKNNLPSLGFRLKTGPVVDFRAVEYLKTEEKDNVVPLFWAYNYDKYEINYPVYVAKKPQYIDCTESSKKVLLNNRNYLFLKRFTSKEEKRRIQCAIYLKETFSGSYIGVENHLNYITKLNGDINEDELYGLFSIFNSSYIDNYFRIINGSTQVNANEINTIPLPEIQDIMDLGKRIKKLKDLSVKTCDYLIEEKFKKCILNNAV